MKATTGVVVAAGALVVLSGRVASAQGFEGDVPPSYLSSPLRAPGNALELGVSAGYAQGFGDIAGGRSLRDVSGAGTAVAVKLGYRATPKLGLGLTSSYEEYMATGPERQRTDVRGMTVGVETRFHLAPFERVDPVISLGSGYRAFATDAPGQRRDTITHGVELARLNATIDVRMSDSVALGPSIGGGLNVFLVESAGASGRAREVRDSRVNSFVFAGLEGRFDVGGQRVREVVVVRRR
ncbi:hypothetical protein SOCEGT47_051460 [Sorangium cellulosum]|uniref:Outer membrane protein beta-barrel domain-containing protein n=1 Tax=Sorangium cellulosum TaxID=56 RepID=A0A4P2Q5B6_SORCE|nr:hypothetical protein [Sorangium cellulosum]AUX24607.1 hypothetical protein SOCEGT47_051460 [Sorangium cellulosum]